MNAIKKTIIYGAAAAITIGALMYSLPARFGIRRTTGPDIQIKRTLISREIYKYPDKNGDRELSQSEMEKFLENTKPNKEEYRNLHGRFDFDDWAESHSLEELEKIAQNYGLAVQQEQ